ncbi:MAG: molybdenum cofactor guanylyltransferase [Candidatus Cloacimonetes bacterium]|nr:molybdenum cofactor guanylyltransferase [Candidatus Cloacimonadota bacterium]
MKKISHISAVILNGGNSKRMGEDKSLLKINGCPLLQLVYEKLNLLFEEVIIIVNNKENYNFFHDAKIYEDIIKNKGPLGGIYTGLKYISKPGAFFFAADMLNLNNELIRKMSDKAAVMKNFDVIIARHIDKIEPLHSIYSKSLLNNIEHSILNDRLKIRLIYNFAKNVYYFDVDEKQTREKNYFLNINTKTEFKHWEKHYSEIIEIGA